MLVLGLDQSFTGTGYCLLSPNNEIVDCGIIRTESKDDIYYRVQFILSEIIDMCADHEPWLVGVEGLAFSAKGNATRNLGGLHFAIVIHLRYNLDYGDRVQVVAPNTVKKFATGKGNDKKEIMFEHIPNSHKKIITELGLCKKETLDVSDAYWIAQYTRSKNDKHTNGCQPTNDCI